MTFDVTSLVDFGSDNNAWKLSLVNTRHSLINETKLLKQLLPKNSDEQALQKIRSRYRRKLQKGTLRFNGYIFRQRYLKWIYSRFSNSLANHRMVQQDEQAFLIEWAKQFNQNHHHLKIIWIVPQGNESELIAHLLMIGFSQDQHKYSFDLKRAFKTEYNSSWPVAFYHFEAIEGQRMAKVMQSELNQDIPDSQFRFANVPLNADQIAELQPEFHRQMLLPKPVKHHYRKPTKSSQSSSVSVTQTTVRSSSKLSSLISQSSSWATQSLANASSITSLTSKLSSAVLANSQLSTKLKRHRKSHHRLSRCYKSLSSRADSLNANLKQSSHSSVPSSFKSQMSHEKAQVSSVSVQLISLHSQLTEQSKQNSQYRQNFRSTELSSCRSYYHSLAASELKVGHSSLASKSRLLKLRGKRLELSKSLGAVYGVSDTSNAASEADDRYHQEIADNFSGSFDRRNFSNAFDEINSHRINYIPIIIIASVVVIILLIFILPFLKI